MDTINQQFSYIAYQPTPTQRKNYTYREYIVRTTLAQNNLEHSSSGTGCGRSNSASSLDLTSWSRFESPDIVTLNEKQNINDMTAAMEWGPTISSASDLPRRRPNWTNDNVWSRKRSMRRLQFGILSRVTPSIRDRCRTALLSLRRTTDVMFACGPCALAFRL
ncbi:uncharacterized protein EI90DRAFT_2064986 [Cantharellus anzutake]|uniref:uncharacterized protein n=1 Tax=Cantharellus anzutake TaxID=1750568 RepID=UPI001903492B|nr:uncharacterized protein EI90DRAFT_2064986 [Cantharellus anzutake]KAF8340452.1 hypothetical protein EI90DRAFT_2064986 [Cantharellus anzutake]